MKKALLIAAATALPFAAHADIVGLTAGPYQWNQDWDGDVQSGSTGTSIDIQDDFGYDNDSGNSFYIAFEHPVPLLPNIRLQHTQLKIDETNTLTRTITFEGDTYTAGTSVSSETDLTHTDATLYYEILDNWVSVDVGLTARVFDGRIEVDSAAFSGEADFDGILPMVYGRARFDLPLTGLFAHANLNAIKYGDDSIIDMAIGLGYEIGPFAANVGYRNFDIEIEDGDDEANLTVDGYFLGVEFDI